MDRTAHASRQSQRGAELKGKRGHRERETKRDLAREFHAHPSNAAKANRQRNKLAEEGSPEHRLQALRREPRICVEPMRTERPIVEHNASTYRNCCQRQTQNRWDQHTPLPRLDHAPTHDNDCERKPDRRQSARIGVLGGRWRIEARGRHGCVSHHFE